MPPVSRCLLPGGVHLAVLGAVKFLFFRRNLLPASLVAQPVKNLPAMQETQVPSLGWEDPLEKGTVTHSSIPAWRIPWTEKPGRLQFRGHRKSETLSKLLY